jgi:hypothetical protein
MDLRGTPEVLVSSRRTRGVVSRNLMEKGFTFFSVIIVSMRIGRLSILNPTTLFKNKPKRGSAPCASTHIGEKSLLGSVPI